MSIIVYPIPLNIAERFRDDGRDDLGQPVVRRIATAEGGFPCRDTLRDPPVGTPVLLGLYRPFARPGPYSEIGPVFVEAEPGATSEPLDRLPDMILRRPLITARAYDGDDAIRDARVAPGAQIGDEIARLLDHEATVFVHLRNAGWGCFLCRVERG